MSNDEMDAHLGLQIGNLDLQSALQSTKPIDEPPPGWTVDQRETSTGRKYKVSSKYSSK